jgi:hypothetical protein
VGADDLLFLKEMAEPVGSNGPSLPIHGAPSCFGGLPSGSANDKGQRSRWLVRRVASLTSELR